MPKIMRWFGLIAVVFTVVCSMGGCERDLTPVRFNNVCRVFLQNEYKYIIYIQSDGSSEVVSRTLNSIDFQKVRVVMDVPDGEPMYVTGMRQKMAVDSDYYGHWIIHIHGPQSIEGAENKERGSKTTRHYRNSPVE